MSIANKLCERLTVCYVAALVAIGSFFGILGLFESSPFSVPELFLFAFGLALAFSGPIYLLTLLIAGVFARPIILHPLLWIGPGTLIAAGICLAAVPASGGTIGAIAAVFIGSAFYAWNARFPLIVNPIAAGKSEA